MANFFINLDSDLKERFDISKFFEFTDNYDPLTSNFAKDILKVKQSGAYVVQGEDGRPDLLSQRIFGTTQYWWVLLLYNRLTDYRSIATGDTISIPDLDDLENLYFSLKSQQTALG